MNWFLIIMASIIIFSTISIKMSVKFKYSLIENMGFIEFKVFGILFYYTNIVLIGDYLNLSNKKQKSINIKIDFKDDNFVFFGNLIKQVSKKLYSKKLDIDMQVCLENPFVVALLGASVRILTSILLIKFKNKNKDADILKNINIGNRHNILVLQANYYFNITMFDFLWSLYKSITVIRREYEKERRKSQLQYNNR